MFDCSGVVDRTLKSKIQLLCLKLSGKEILFVLLELSKNVYEDIFEQDIRS